jgi:hypothetical protein
MRHAEYDQRAPIPRGRNGTGWAFLLSISEAEVSAQKSGVVSSGRGATPKLKWSKLFSAQGVSVSGRPWTRRNR